MPQKLFVNVWISQTIFVAFANNFYFNIEKPVDLVSFTPEHISKTAECLADTLVFLPYPIFCKIVLLDSNVFVLVGSWELIINHYSQSI